MRGNYFPVEGKSYVVLGLARTGLQALKWLKSNGANAQGWDDSIEAREAATKAGYSVAQSDSFNWPDIAALVQSPGVPADHPLSVQATGAAVPVITDCDLLRASNPQARFVGITGTNGKSTTTALVNHILKEAGLEVECGGNIGVPVLGLKSVTQAGIYVLELSSYQLELSDALDLQVGVFLNLTPDHLERHHTMQSYFDAKRRVFESSDARQVMILGVDDQVCHDFYDSLRTTTSKALIPVSSSGEAVQGVYFSNGVLIDNREEQMTPVIDLREISTLAGAHNHQNAAAAYAVAVSLGVPFEKAGKALASYPGLPHRQEVVGEEEGILFINDSKATNPIAASKALSSYKDIYWIAGGEPKEGSWEPLLEAFGNVRQAFLIGQAQRQLAAFLQGKVAYSISDDLATAVSQAYKQAKRDGADHPVILLSPGCASFDQFKDFEDRGEAFRRLVKLLTEPKKEATANVY